MRGLQRPFIYSNSPAWDDDELTGGARRRLKRPRSTRKRKSVPPMRRPRRIRKYTLKVRKSSAVPVTPAGKTYAPPIRKPVDRVVMVDRDSVWRGVQSPQHQQFPPYWFLQPQIGPMPPSVHNINVNVPQRGLPEREEVYQDAREHVEPPSRRPTDGEEDTDARTQSRWSFNQVLDYMERIPARARRAILTGLFGTAIGVVLDILLGGTLGLSSRVFRLIIGMVPGGNLILGAFDALGYIFGGFGGYSDDPLQITYDPGFRNLAGSLQTTLPSATAEALMHAAESQVGGGLMRNIASVLGAAVSAATTYTPAAAAVPLAMVRPFRP